MSDMRDIITMAISMARELADKYRMTHNDKETLENIMASMCYEWAFSNACACASETVAKENGVEIVKLILPMKRFNQIVHEKLKATLPEDESVWDFADDCTEEDDMAGRWSWFVHDGDAPDLGEDD